MDTPQTDGGRHSMMRAGHLEDVFDDPAHGEIGRDRLGVHFAWEGVLAVAAIVMGYLLFTQHRSVVSGGELKFALVDAAILGLLALSAAISLRVATPNLALGTVAVASSIFYASNSDGGLVPTAVKIMAFALALGVAMAILVVGFHIPAWAGTLAGALVTLVWINKHPNPLIVAGEFEPSDYATYLLAGFAVLSVLAGVLGAIKPIRRGVGRYRSVGDPATRRGGLASTVAALGLILSTLLAAVAGILLGAIAGERSLMVSPTTGLEWTSLALGAALVGGVSAFGRRGGVFGTLLAVALVSELLLFEAAAGWKISVYAIGAAAVATGLIVTRLVETFGRPLPLDDNPDDWADVGIGTGGWATGSPAAGMSNTNTWAGLPAQPSAPANPPTWTTTEDRWR